MLLISFALVGNILYNLLLILTGGYLLLLFNGILNPKFKTPEAQQKFEDYKEKRGTFVLLTAFMLTLLGCIQLLSALGFLNLGI